MRIELGNGEHVLIDVVRKNVCNITMRVYRGGVVRITMPYGTSEAAAREFAQSNAGWLERRLKERVNCDPTGTIRMEGRALVLEKKQDAAKSGVEQCGGRLVVHGPSDAAMKRAFDQWWRRRVLSTCSVYIEKWYPVLAQCGCDEPEISVRKMKSAWGSCSRAGKIHFNYYLLCAPAAEIEYVVLHELAHLVYPNHGRRFAAFMSEHMPDWKKRRAALRESVRYIESF